MPTPLRMARQARGWSHSELRDRMRQEAARWGERLPGESSLHRMVVRWEQGEVMPAEFYRRVFCQVYQAEPARLGFPDNGAFDQQAMAADIATALLYAAPLTNEQIAAQPGHRLHLYIMAALDDPSCPELDTLADGVDRARRDAPQWLDPQRLAVCEQAARRAVHHDQPPRPATGTGPVPDWLAAGRMVGTRHTAAVFGTGGRSIGTAEPPGRTVLRLVPE